MPPGARSVTRPSKWGNPFVIGRDGDHDEVVEMHRTWVANGGLEAAGLDPAELRGLDLGCWCRPDQTCHADTLIELAARTPCEGSR
jgi:hypothetical protein